MVEVFKYSDTMWEFYAADKHSHTDLLVTRFHHRVLDYHRNSGRVTCTTHARNVYSCPIIKTGHTLTPGDYVTPARLIRYPGHSALQPFGPSLVAPDFVGWAGLGPIALLIENIIGIQANVPEREIVWYVNRTDRHGIQNLWLGEMGKFDLIAAARTDINQPISITAASTGATTSETSIRLRVVDVNHGCERTFDVILGQSGVSFTASCVPALLIRPPILLGTEGRQYAYTVALATQPSATVTVAISGHAGSDLVLDNTSLTFSTTNWNTPQPVTIRVGEDTDTEPDSVTLTHSASGGDYGSVSKTLKVTITDNDSRGLDISQAALTVTEGDAAGQSYTVALTSQPSSAVTVTISGQASSDLVVDPSSLTFSTGNWDTAQTVTVTARDDADAITDEPVILTHRASGGDYGAVTRTLGVIITEIDSPNLDISQAALTVVEGNAAGQSYTVALTTQPSNTVAVAISGQAGSDLVVDPSSLSFSTSNWSAAQTVKVTARDDADALTDPVVALTHRASGGDYGGVTGDLRVTITEKSDVLALDISQSALTVVEGDAAGQSYTVALTTQPSAAVTVTISGQAGSDLVVDPSSLTFSTSNWSAAQTVTVTASDDADAITDEPVILTHSASGGDYGAVTRDLTRDHYRERLARAGHLPVRLHGDRGRSNRPELHRGAGHSALGGGDGDDQRTGGQRPGRGQAQPQL